MKFLDLKQIGCESLVAEKKIKKNIQIIWLILNRLLIYFFNIIPYALRIFL